MDIFQALADPNRRMIMAQLNLADELSISELSQSHTMSRQALSKHLSKLVEAGIIDKRKSGKASLHSLNPKSLQELAVWLEPYAARWDQKLSQLKALAEQNHIEGTNHE